MIEARVLIQGPLGVGRPARLEAHMLTPGQVVEKIIFLSSGENLDGTISLNVELILRTTKPSVSRR